MPKASGNHREALAQTDPDAPMRLSVLAALTFPDGTMTPSSLRREAARGRLIIEQVAGKDYSTINHVRRMRELCRVKHNDQDSGCD